MTLLYILLIPMLGITIYYLKDADKRKSRSWNVLMIANGLLFLSPLLYAYVDALPDGNMWSSNGSGAVLWLYLLFVPVCWSILVLLFVFRSRFKKKKQITPDNFVNSQTEKHNIQSSANML